MKRKRIRNGQDATVVTRELMFQQKTKEKSKKDVQRQKGNAMAMKKRRK
jgi:hypothetical protein